MKELTQAFNLRTELHPNLSSYVCFLRACRDVKAKGVLIRRGFSKLVELEDYQKGDYAKIIKSFIKGVEKFDEKRIDPNYRNYKRRG